MILVQYEEERGFTSIITRGAGSLGGIPLHLTIIHESKAEMKARNFDKDVEGYPLDQ